jgi:hypothetical protein
MSEESWQSGSDTPEEHEDVGPEAESRLDIAAAVEYGERYEACQVTVRKVQAARRLIELAGGYKEAVVLVDALWFADIDNPDEATTGASNIVSDEDDSESEYQPDYKVWVARVRRVMAAEKLLQVASGYAEALVLLDTVVLVSPGKEGYQQVVKVRDAVAGYHRRVAAALKRKDEGE